MYGNDELTACAISPASPSMFDDDERTEPGTQAPSAAMPYLGNASFDARMLALKSLADSAGIRLPPTIIPEGTALLPGGVERQRQLKAEIDELPTVEQGLAKVAAYVKASDFKDVAVKFSGVRMDAKSGGLLDASAPDVAPIGYTPLGFRHAVDLVRPAGVRSGADTLLSLSPGVRASAFNEWASRRAHAGPDGQEKAIVLRTQLAARDSRTARVVRAVTSEKYSPIEDDVLLATLRDHLPAGAKLRVTMEHERSSFELIWPMLERELRVGDVALGGVEIVNSGVKAAGIRIVPRLLRVLCWNFTTAFSEGGEEDISIRHMGELAPKLAPALRRALAKIDPFVKAFGDAYRDNLPAAFPTRTEAVQRALKKFQELRCLPVDTVVDAWGMDGAAGAGNTRAGFVHAFTRASQKLDMERAALVEKVAGRVVHQGWSALN